MTQHHPFDFQETEENSNTSNNREFSDVLNKRASRRSVIKGGTGLTAAAFFGALPLAGCNNDNNGWRGTGGTGGTVTDPAVPATGDLTLPQKLNFTAVAHSTEAEMTVAEGYTAEAILHLGDPIRPGIAAWRDDREQSGESFEYRMGDNHDGIWFFGKRGSNYHAHNSENGLLVSNHEYVNPSELHPLVDGQLRVTQDDNAAPIYQRRRPASDIRREINAHGVSVVEMKRRANGVGYEMVLNSAFNKRHTSASEFQLTGPVAGSDLAKTKFDPTGHKTRGMNNQCGSGLSPWGTYLTTEENFINVFARGADKAIIGDKADAGHVRYGVGENRNSPYMWHTGNSSEAKYADEFSRWDITAVAASAVEDYRNAYHTFGYIVEIDPFKPNQNPVKRTALGRFAHENCAYAPVVEGKPVVFYMGDDARGEYIYKFVSKANWSNADIGGGLSAGAKYLDEGTLYVAVYKEDGTGEWKELAHGKNGLTASATPMSFNNHAEVMVYTRAAGDLVGATKMDRPEWISVSPVTGEVYVTLTNNSSRTPEMVDAANPRSHNDASGRPRGNQHGHILRWAEKDNDHTATTFTWDVYLFASAHDLLPENLSGLTANNDLSAPDGLYFDPRGVLWIQTDDSGQYLHRTNCMLLAALPGEVGDGQRVTTSVGQETIVGQKATEDTVKRFFVGPRGCEVTGISLTPDFKTMFINIQHPGESWGAVAGGSTPRSATVMITKDDGDVILAESLPAKTQA